MRTHQRLTRLAAAVLVSSASAGIAPGPIAVDAGVTTAGSWIGTVTLSNFPCPSGGCAGSFVASLTGTAIGTDTSGNPYAVVWPDPTATTTPPPMNLSASFQYSEDCPLGQTGHASGSYTVTGGLVNENGAVSHAGTLQGQFDYVRVGTVFVVTTSAGALYAGTTLLASQAVPPGVGVGAMVPNAPPIATCLPGQAAQITATVAGSYGSPQ